MQTEPTEPQFFAGKVRHGLDPKNRITIPSKWRNSEPEDFHLIVDSTETHLKAMPPARFRAIRDSVHQNTSIPAAQRNEFLRDFYANSEVVTTDKQGRIVIPEEFRLRLNLTGELMLVGVSDNFEIWNSNVWDTRSKTARQTLTSIYTDLGL